MVRGDALANEVQPGLALEWAGRFEVSGFIRVQGLGFRVAVV